MTRSTGPASRIRRCCACPVSCKRLKLLRELVPQAAITAVLFETQPVRDADLQRLATIDLETEPDRCHRTLEGNWERCGSELFHTSLVVQKMHGRAGRPKNNGALECLRQEVTLQTCSLTLQTYPSSIGVLPG